MIYGGRVDVNVAGLACLDMGLDCMRQMVVIMAHHEIIVVIVLAS